VIIAAPFHQTSITVPKSVADQIPPQPYINLHVTLLSTNASSPNPSYFGLPEGSAVPQVVLTSRANSRKGGKEPEFNSLSYHGSTREGEYAVKIFSMQHLSDEWLDGVFPGAVGWVHRKEVSFLSALSFLPFIHSIMVVGLAPPRMTVDIEPDPDR
jgi:prenylcysteine oxidase/farnesylcysteine lyase